LLRGEIATWTSQGGLAAGAAAAADSWVAVSAALGDASAGCVAGARALRAVGLDGLATRADSAAVAANPPGAAVAPACTGGRHAGSSSGAVGPGPACAAVRAGATAGALAATATSAAVPALPAFPALGGVAGEA
jgi:hypothetical protein